MCGIAGFWQNEKSPEHPIEILNRMGNTLAHRGPDDSGAFHDDSAGLGLAFRRLAILDLSPEGHQPMFSFSGRYVVVFNGEVYNYEDIRLEIGPHQWRGHSDTEVILEAFERWGVEATVRRFVGMFAIALWDRLERRFYLVRDRLGIKPLYYGRAGSAFVFASELKAIGQHPEFSSEIDRDALALYLRHSYVPSPHCIYKDLRKLPPGCILRLDSASEAPIVHRYWSADEAARSGLLLPLEISDNEAVEELHRLLAKAVRLRMIADVPLGAFLSGGVDSTAVVALMQAQNNRPVKTFTIGFHEQGYNEAIHAKGVAAHLGTDHTELYLTDRDALNVVPLLPAMYDEPFSDSSQIPTYLVSKLARSQVTVSLSGDGGDELFGGYDRYFLMRRVWNFLKRSPLFIRKAFSKTLLSVPTDRLNRALQMTPSTFLGDGKALLGDKLHKLADVLIVDSPGALYYRSLSYWKSPTEIILNSREPATVRESIAESFDLPRIEEAMMLADQINYLPDDVLTKVDRASMAVSLEARVPLLDHRVVEFAWKLPLHFKIRNKTSKWILRQILYKYVPPKLVERPKMGFGVPVDQWLRGPLRDWAEDLLSQKSLSEHSLLNADTIRLKWQEHLSEKGNWQYQLWDILAFQDWFRHNTSVCSPPEPHCSKDLGFMSAGLRGSE